jgi:Leucine-rich repeat (LRR) protein
MADEFTKQNKAEVMMCLQRSRSVGACLLLSLLSLTGCPKSQTPDGGTGASSSPSTSGSNEQAPAAPTKKGTASAEDVKAAKARVDALGSRSRYSPKEGDLLTEIVIQDGSNLTAEDVELFGKLSGLEKLQIYNCRTLNGEMATKLSGLKKLTTLALTNSVINDSTVEMIVKSFPDLVELDLSSNTNMTNGVVKILSELGKLQRLTLVQNQVNDIGARRLSKLQDLRMLDLRGNMEAGDMALEVVAELPKLTGFKHRSTAVTDSGLEYLSRNQTLDSLLMQDFVITDQSGPHLAKLGKLTQLEVFRCQGFGTEGVLALKGMNLTRLTLRDLPNIDDRALEVFDDMPKLRRLYLHELTSVGDSGLSHLAAIKSLELLDIWTVPQMTDATLDVIATLPNLKDLSIRATGVTDASVDKLLKMQSLQSLTFKENGAVTAEGLKKLASRKWTKLDVGSSANNDESAGQ